MILSSVDVFLYCGLKKDNTYMEIISNSKNGSKDNPDIFKLLFNKIVVITI